MYIVFLARYIELVTNIRTRKGGDGDEYREYFKNVKWFFFSYFIFEVKFVIFTDRLNIIEYSSENIK